MTNTQQLNQNLTGQKIDNGALELVSVIGIGAYGVVYKALARDGKYYAVKCLNKTGLDSRQRGFQRREIALHTLASSHPNIVTLHNVIETPTCIYVVLSYCSDGDLFSQITEKSTYLGNDALIKDVFLQIVEAVEYCHRLGIYHRDLKPENILCDQGGRRVVLADFGLATAEKTSGDFGCGSTFYMSPGKLFVPDQYSPSLICLSFPSKRMSRRALSTIGFILNTAQRRLVPWCYSGQSDMRTQSMEASVSQR